MAAGPLSAAATGAVLAALLAAPAVAQSWVLPPEAEVELAAAVSAVQAEAADCGKLLGASLQQDRVELKVELPPAPQAPGEPAAPDSNKPIRQLWSLRRAERAPYYELVGAPPCPALVESLLRALSQHVRKDPWKKTAGASRAELAGAHVVAPRDSREALPLAGAALAALLATTLWGVRSARSDDPPR